jgi:hypothetical protein
LSITIIFLYKYYCFLSILELLGVGCTFGVVLTLGLDPILGLLIIGLLPSLALGGLGGKGDVIPGLGLSFILGNLVTFLFLLGVIITCGI